MRLFRVAVVVTSLASFGMLGCGPADVADQPQPTKSAEEEMKEMDAMAEKMKEMAPQSSAPVSTGAPSETP